MKREIKFIIQMIRKNFLLDYQYDTDSLDWENVIDILKNHRIFINSYNVLKCNIPEGYLNEIDELYNNYIKSIDNNIKHLDRFSREAQNEHVRYVLVKGLGLGKQIYGDFYSRQANDLDILVSEDDMIRGHHVLKKLGYKQPNIVDFKTLQYSELDYPIMRLRHTNHYFEYYTLNKEDWCKIELHKKLYYISSQFIDDFLWNVSQIEIGTVKINILDTNYSFIMLLANAFENSEALYSLQGNCKIREYIDLYNSNFPHQKWDSHLEKSIL